MYFSTHAIPHLEPRPYTTVFHCEVRVIPEPQARKPLRNFACLTFPGPTLTRKSPGYVSSVLCGSGAGAAIAYVYLRTVRAVLRSVCLGSFSELLSLYLFYFVSGRDLRIRLEVVGHFLEYGSQL